VLVHRSKGAPASRKRGGGDLFHVLRYEEGERESLCGVDPRAKGRRIIESTGRSKKRIRFFRGGGEEGAISQCAKKGGRGPTRGREKRRHRDDTKKKGAIDVAGKESLCCLDSIRRGGEKKSYVTKEEEKKNLSIVTERSEGSSSFRWIKRTEKRTLPIP